jgi:hypothetical protein
MQTTLTIDDDVLEVAERIATERSVPIGAVISELVRKGLERTPAYDIRNGVPVFRVPPGTKSFTSEDVRRADEEW